MKTFKEIKELVKTNWKSYLKKWWYVPVLVVFVAGCGIQKRHVHNLKAAKNELKTEVKELQTSNKSLQTTNANYQLEIEKLQKQIAIAPDTVYTTKKKRRK